MRNTMLSILMLVSGVAYGQGRYDDELSGNVGGQVGLHDSPGGGMFGAEYAHRVSRDAWFDAMVDGTFGGNRVCFVDNAGFMDCGAASGQSLCLIAGVKWKFHTRNERLVPHAKIGGGLAFLFFPGADNDGIAPVVRGGGGLKYFVLPQLGIGGEMTATFGPGFYGCGPQCTTS